EARVQAEKVAAEAAKAVAEAEKKVAATKQAAEAATKAATDAQAAVQKTQQSINDLKAKIAAGEKEVGQFDEQLAAATQEIQNAGKSAEESRGKWIEQSRAAEALLKEAGAWVSFSDEIAPIFHDRCLACHNARIAKGRYNMENFASIMKGGESGSVVDAGDTDSLLCILIDDGSMPKEADPLTPDQISIIKRWIQLGANLDAGVDVAAPLLQIMPERPQPAPPEVYPAPIPITAVAFSPDGTLLASSGYHEVLLWSVETGEIVRRISNLAERTYAISFHPDGTRLAVASGTPGRIGEVKLFQVADGALLASLATVEDAMFDVAFSPDGQRLAAGGADRAIRIFDLTSLAETLLIEDHADWVLSIDWSPDGSMLVSGSRDKTCKLFDANSGDSKGTFNGHGEVVAAAAFLADGKQVVSGGRDKQLRVWKVDDTKEVRKTGGFGDEITHLTLLPSDHVLVASADKNGRIVNAADGKTLKTLSGHQDWLYSSAAHPASGVCATGSYDGEIRLWKLDDATLIRQWIAKP
ncbi:MAG: hypothetical protein KDA90_11560, partial [Planctomycetaceae bacterium]|nr:hypothetical protein [Planctomycetaceae bacterium]